MPTPDQILEGLTRIANEAFPVAVVWHLAIGLAVLALLVGWRPSRRLAAVLLAMPIVSVGVLAFAFANPFNGTIFALLALALVAGGVRLPADRVARGPGWAFAIGAGMVAFGLLYPHFLVDRPAVAYLYGAPVGLVPCPTLSVVIGFALVGGGLSSRLWSIGLAAAGLFYGLFGAFRLGVPIDAVLVAGAAGLLFTGLMPRRRAIRSQPAAA